MWPQLKQRLSWLRQDWSRAKDQVGRVHEQDSGPAAVRQRIEQVARRAAQRKQERL